MSDNQEEDKRFFWDECYIKLLITTRLEMDDEFLNPKVKKKKLWQRISNIMKDFTGSDVLTPDFCDCKWRNLLMTYKKNALKHKTTGADINWPYFELINNIFGERLVIRPSQDPGSGVVKDAVEDFHENSESNDSFKIIMVKSETDDLESEDVRIKSVSKEIQLLRKELAAKRKQDEMIFEDKRARWEEKKILEIERTEALLKLTAAITKYTEKNVDLISQKVL